jgi:hypothetical protein
MIAEKDGGLISRTVTIREESQLDRVDRAVEQARIALSDSGAGEAPHLEALLGDAIGGLIDAVEMLALEVRVLRKRADERDGRRRCHVDVQLPEVGRVWAHRPLPNAPEANAWTLCLHPGTSKGAWLVAVVRFSEATIRTQFVNHLGAYRRGALAIVAPDGRVVAAKACT